MERSPYDPEQSRRFMEHAERALARQNAAEALDALDEARRWDPHNDEIPLLAASLHLEAGAPARTAELSLAAVTIRPCHPAALNLLGVACLDAGDARLAREVLERAVRLAPARPKIRKNLAAAKRAARKNSSAVEREAQLPRQAIRAALEEQEPSLSVCLMLGDGDEPRLAARIAAARSMARETLIVDARREPGAAPQLPSETRWIALPDAAADPARLRNEALRQCRGDWILWLEPDEILDETSIAPLRAALGRTDVLAYTVVLREGDDEALRVVRLFRNAPGARFHPTLDERLLPALVKLEADWGLGMDACDATLVREPGSRPLGATTPEALAAALDELDPSDPVAIAVHERLAALELDCGRPDLALAHLDLARARRTGRGRPLDLEEPTVLEGRCLMRQQRFEDLERLLSRYHADHTPTVGTLFLAGLAAKACRQSERAAELLVEAIELEGHPCHAALPVEARGVGLPNLLGAALLDCGRLEDADEAFGIALSREPDHLDAQLGRLAILHSVGEFADVLEELDRLVDTHGDDPKIWLGGEIFLGRVPALATPTVDWLEAARERFPENVEIMRRLGEAQLRRGSADQALEILGGLTLQTADVDAARVAAALACGRDLPAVDSARLEPVERGVLAWFERWMAYGALEALDRALLEITRAEQGLPGLGARTASWLDGIGQPEAAAGVRERISALAPG